MRDEPVMLSREQWAEVSEELNTLRARVAELEQRLGRHQDPETGQWLDSVDLYRLREMVAIDDRRAAESQLAKQNTKLHDLETIAVPELQLSLKEANEQLTKLLEENLYLKEIYVEMGLHDSACRIDTDGECDCWHERFAAELQSLLDQTAKVEGK